MSARQHNRAKLLWEGPGGELEIVEFRLEEEISEPFTISITVKTDSKTLKPKELLNAEGKVVMFCGEDFTEKRYFKGIISDMVVGRTGHANIANPADPVYFYSLQLKPAFWRLSHVFRSKVFQKMTVVDILDQVLGEFGIDHALDITGTHPLRHYCVQYEETDLDFLSRLMEEEGIFYYFDHETGQMKIADHSGGHKDCKPFSEILYVEGGHVGSFARRDAEHIHRLEYRVRMGTGAFVFNDYNYEKSAVDNKAKKEKDEIPLLAAFEHYEHSSKQLDQGEGKELAQWNRERVEAHCHELIGHSNARSLMTGFKFLLKNHFRDEMEKNWLVIRLQIEVDGQGNFQAVFRAIPLDVVFRPRRKTPRPKVTGLQTAVVTGPSGSKVYLDELGRCKVQFHWDREGGKDENASMWVRVSNGYAGKNYGIQWIPRVGHEVLVEFVDGDPDRPVVVGRVYNDVNTPPLGPAKKWQNIIKTIKDNHIMFDDEDGKELIDIRAHKNMNTLVENDKTRTVGHDNTETVKHNQKVTVEGEHYKMAVTTGEYCETVHTDFTSIVEKGDLSLSVMTGTYIQNIQNGKLVAVHSSDYVIQVAGGSMGTTVSSDILIAAGGSINVRATADIDNSCTRYAVAAGSSCQLTSPSVTIVTSSFSVGATNLLLSVGAATLNMSAASIALSLGGSSVVLSPAGVTITGPTVTLAGLIKHNC